MFIGAEIVAILEELGISHVVWVPDSTLGTWEQALEASSRLTLVRVCREGEAWPLAAGLHLGGCKPVVVMQTTGLFESGDALRNVLFDLHMPLFAMIGVRNGVVSNSRDSANTFAEPIVQAWGIPYVYLRTAHDKELLADHYQRCRASRQPGLALFAEAAM